MITRRLTVVRFWMSVLSSIDGFVWIGDTALVGRGQRVTTDGFSVYDAATH